jgi:hypothetical protein
MLRYTHPWLALMLHYWPAAILLPTIFVLVAVLVQITRWRDRRDAERAYAVRRRAAS